MDFCAANLLNSLLPCPTRKASPSAISAPSSSPPRCSGRVGISPRRCVKKSPSPRAASSCAASCTRGASRSGPTTSYYDDGSGKAPRYYQVIAINRTIEAIARGQQRILLVMATGTGKTYTAFQIIWRLWKSGQKSASSSSPTATSSSTRPRPTTSSPSARR
jgi:hypothetical protein